MVTDAQGTFSKLLSENDVLFRDSFVDEKVNLTDVQIQILGKYVGDFVQYIVPLHARKFYVSFMNSCKYSIGYSKPQVNIETKTEHVTFYPFLIQTSSNLFLVVASKYHIYDFLSREPHDEGTGEYWYQAQLAKVLGLKNARAYDLPKEQLLDKKVVLQNDLELMYCGDNIFSFLIYSL